MTILGRPHELDLVLALLLGQEGHYMMTILGWLHHVLAGGGQQAAIRNAAPAYSLAFWSIGCCAVLRLDTAVNAAFASSESAHNGSDLSSDTDAKYRNAAMACILASRPSAVILSKTTPAEAMIAARKLSSAHMDSLLAGADAMFRKAPIATARALPLDFDSADASEGAAAAQTTTSLTRASLHKPALSLLLMQARW